MKGRFSILRKLTLVLIVFALLLTAALIAFFSEDFIVITSPEGRFTLSLILLIDRFAQKIALTQDPRELQTFLEENVGGDIIYAQVVKEGKVLAEAKRITVELPIEPLIGASLIQRRQLNRLHYLDLRIPLSDLRRKLLDPETLKRILQGRGSFTIEVTPNTTQQLGEAGYLRLGLSEAFLLRARLLRYGLSGLFLLGALGVVLWFHRSLARSIRQLMGAVRRFSQGDLKTRVEIQSGDELEVLGQEFNRMADELAKRTQQLTKANAAKSRFLAMMSHELRTPLQAILGYADLLQRDLGGRLDEAGRKYAQGILTSGKHLLRLVENLLQFSKLETDEERLHLEPVEIYQLVETAVREVEFFVQEKRASIQTAVEKGQRIEADRAKLHQVLINLLMNALAAVEFEKGKIVIRARMQGDEACFSVSDNGRGIPVEAQGKIFQPFQQIQDHKQAGVGLGLAIVKRYVEMHGGRVWFESEMGRGSTFYFAVPRGGPDEDSYRGR